MLRNIREQKGVGSSTDAQCLFVREVAVLLICFHNALSFGKKSSNLQFSALADLWIWNILKRRELFLFVSKGIGEMG